MGYSSTTSVIRVLLLLLRWIKLTLEPPYDQWLEISITCSSWGCRWEWTDSRWAHMTGRSIDLLPPCGSHQSSRRCWCRWECGPGGAPPNVGRPTYTLGGWPTTLLHMLSPLVISNVLLIYGGFGSWSSLLHLSLIRLDLWLFPPASK